MSSELCPVYAPFFGAMGCTSAIVFTCTSHPSVTRNYANSYPTFHLSGIGAAYGTAKSGVGISAMSVLRPDLMMKCVVPVIMAGIIAIVSRSRCVCSVGWMATDRAGWSARYAAGSKRGGWEMSRQGMRRKTGANGPSTTPLADVLKISEGSARCQAAQIRARWIISCALPHRLQRFLKRFKHSSERSHDVRS